MVTSKQVFFRYPLINLSPHRIQNEVLCKFAATILLYYFSMIGTSVANALKDPTYQPTMLSAPILMQPASRKSM